MGPHCRSAICGACAAAAREVVLVSAVLSLDAYPGIFVFFRCHVAYRPVTGQYTATLRRVAFSLVAAGTFSEELSATSLDMPGPWFWWTLDGPFCWSFGGKNKFEIYRPGP